MIEPNTKAAVAALKRYIRSLPAVPPPGTVLPEWLDVPAYPVATYAVNGHACHVFALEQRQNGVTGYVLDAETLAVQEVHDGQVALALARVGLEPTPGVGTPWKRGKRK